MIPVGNPIFLPVVLLFEGAAVTQCCCSELGSKMVCGCPMKGIFILSRPEKIF